MTLTCILEFHQTAGFGLPPTSGWTNISAYLDAESVATITRGRADERPAVTPSTLTAILDNTDGRFTPGNSSSPYYPNITTPKWVRFSVTDGTTTWRRFTGLIDTWKPYLTGANSYKQVELDATDVLKALGRSLRASVARVVNKALPIGSFLQEEILLDTPLAYYPLNDGSNAVSFADLSGNSQPALQILSQGSRGKISSGGTAGPPGDGASTVGFTPYYGPDNVTQEGDYLQTTLNPALSVGTGSAWTFECWMNVANDGPAPSTSTAGLNYDYVAAALCDNGLFSGTTILTYYHTAVAGKTYLNEGGGNSIMSYQINGVGGLNAGPELVPGAWYHFAVSCSATGTMSFYVNGVKWPWATLGTVPTAVNTLAQLYVGGVPSFGPAFMNGNVAHVAVYQAELTAARIQAHYQAGATGFAGETLSQRVVRVLRYAGFGDLTGSPAIQSSALAVTGQNAATVLALLHDLETTEQGVFFIAGDGTPTFYNRQQRFNGTGAPLVLNAQLNLSSAVAPTFDEATVLNDVTVTTRLGSSFRAQDSTSVGQRGVFHEEFQIVSGSPTNADDTANWILFLYSQPSLRCSDLPVDLLTQPSIATAVLNADMFTFVSFTNLPPSFGGFGNLVVQGMNETWGVTQQEITFHTTPNTSLPTPYVVGPTGNDDSSTNRLGY